MTFKKIPIASIQATINQNPQGLASLPWSGATSRDYKWLVSLDISPQSQSSDVTRNPFQYNGQDITVGQWIANTTTGTAWQITAINSKTATTVVAVVEDIYRYNTYRDPTSNGDGSPTLGQYVVFKISDDGSPIIDPVPASGVSADFTINLQSRFQYINLQYNYPLTQPDNSTVTFVYDDVIAVDDTTHKFVLADAINKKVVGRITSVDDSNKTFTINPVQKIVDDLDSLPGDVGDSIFSSITSPGKLSLDPSGSEMYVKLRNNTQSVSYSGDVLVGVPITSPGNVFEINKVPVTITGTGTPADLVAATNAVSSTTGITASISIPPTVVTTNPLLGFFYGQIGLDTVTPATATINGILVTFDISADGLVVNGNTIATPTDMAAAIDRAAIPNISTMHDSTTLTIIEDIGGTIDIINISPDTNGCNFAGANSGSALQLVTPLGVYKTIKFLAVDARAINFYDVVGATTVDADLESVENGVKAAGLYVANGLRKSTTTVVTNLTQLNLLTPLIGDQAFVLDSNDGNGNNVGEWSMWLYDGAEWVQTSNKDSSSTDAKSLELVLNYDSPMTTIVGTLSNSRRVTLITIEIIDAFPQNATLDIGYRLDIPVTPIINTTGLMSNALIDLSVVDTYTTVSDSRFDSNCDVTLLATYNGNGAGIGQAKIVITYV